MFQVGRAPAVGRRPSGHLVDLDRDLPGGPIPVGTRVGDPPGQREGHQVGRELRPQLTIEIERLLPVHPLAVDRPPPEGGQRPRRPGERVGGRCERLAAAQGAGGFGAGLGRPVARRGLGAGEPAVELADDARLARAWWARQHHHPGTGGIPARIAAISRPSVSTVSCCCGPSGGR